MQKPLISALLVFLVLLNTMGYYFIIVGLELKHDAQMSRSLDDDNYDAISTFTFSIPIALPYQYDNSQFMRVEGKFVHGGETYRLIKQKYERDTLTVICIKDDRDKQIQNALGDVVSTFVDSTADTDAPSGKALNLFVKEYLCTVCSNGNPTLGWVRSLAYPVTTNSPIETYPSLIAQPPEI